MPSETLPDRAQEAPPARPRRVSLILHKFSRGGSDRVAAYLARGFTDRGMIVDLVVFCKGGEVEAILSDIVGSDIPIRYLGKGRGPRPLDLIRGLPKLARLLRAQSPDVVLSTANNTAWISAVALKLAGLRDCRLILKTTNPIARSRHTGLVKWIRRWGYRKIFRWTDAVWTLSAEESTELREEFPEFPTLFEDIANPYVTPAMFREPDNAPLPGRPKTILGVGRLTAQKRYDRLIEAFALVHDQSARLTILGEGEDREMLERLIARLKLQDRVTMPGYVTDVARAFHQADLFVLPSDYEGLPAVALEAMAANCPVLSTDCFPAARSIIGGTTGCAIIEHTDAPRLAALIEAHLSRPRPSHLRDIAERYSVANGIASHAAALIRCMEIEG